MANKRVVLIASQFNREITERLVEGAIKTLIENGIKREDIGVFWVSGGFELPVAAAQAASVLAPDAIIALGCILKGQTPQYIAIGQSVAIGLGQVSVQTKIPVGFGVVIADTVEQAKARAGGDWGNRGSEAATSVLKTLECFSSIASQGSKRHLKRNKNSG
jgi:6,7-dimethyl-8-ribityllumazine synthase